MRVEFCEVIESGSFNDHAPGICQGDSRCRPRIFIDQPHFSKQVIFLQYADQGPVAWGILPEYANATGVNDIGAFAGLALQKNDVIFVKSCEVVIHDDLTFPHRHC